MPDESTAPSAVPAVIISGTPVEVDHFLRAALWPTEGPSPDLATVIAWTAALKLRGVEFASHVSACRFWLYERLNNPARAPLAPKRRK